MAFVFEVLHNLAWVLRKKVDDGCVWVLPVSKDSFGHLAG